VVDGRASSFLAQVVELERRDEEVAADIAALVELDSHAEEIRSRAETVRAELERIPVELRELARGRVEAEQAATAARSELHDAEERLAALERGRRRRTDQVDRARREATTARELLADAVARVERLDSRQGRVHADERALREEAGALRRAARDVADRLTPLSRVAEAARRDPGDTLDEIEEWGALARSGLFVARGTLEVERERIVAEANGYGASVLGESLGASSVAHVRRLLELEIER
jgi:chromosome segregation ATPase